jgi:hypothetical protein
MGLNVLSRLRTRIERLDVIRNRMESLLRRNKITSKDVESVYESLFMRAVVAFETFLEELFFAIAHGKIKYSSRKITCKLSGISEDVIQDIVHQGKSYVNWIPYESTKQRVLLYMRIVGSKANDCGRPFLELKKPQTDSLGNIVIIRNALAHSSNHAMNEYKSKIIGNRPLLPAEKSPAGYLRVKDAASGQTRFEGYVTELISIAALIYGSPMD